jgi:hypothetical protein
VRRERLLVPIVLACACAASTEQVRQARDARYDAELAVIWPALVHEVSEHARVKALDPGARVIVTDWQIIERFADQENASRRSIVAAGSPDVAGRDEDKPAAIFFRYRVHVEGGPPWRVVVDGEAALYRSGVSVLRPYARGAEDEPGWVQGRIDSLAMDVHFALKAFERR